MAAQSIIPVFSGTINNESIQLVDARVLHAFLEVGKNFSAWIKGRISQYFFIEDQDYILTVSKTGERQNVRMNHYHLTLDMAKELSMVERNEKGRQARRYFIDCEKKLHHLFLSSQSQLPIGKKGHECLAGLIDGKTSHLKGKQRTSAKARLWAQLRKGFGVDAAADITADEFNNARQFIGEYVLEGDYLPAGEVEQVALPLDREVPEYQYQEYGKSYEDGQLILKELSRYVPLEVSPLLKQLDAVLVRGWTVTDEALARMKQANSLLHMWRG